MNVEIRPAKGFDREFLVEMLFEAVAWRATTRKPSVDEVLANPDFARYIVDWPPRWRW